MWIYVGTYTRAKSRGIYGIELDEITGQFAAPALMAETPNPSFLAISPAGDRLYAACDPGTFDGRRHGGAAAFAVDRTTRALRPLNTQPSGEGGNCHVGLSADGKILLCADYGSAVVSLLPIEADGSLRPAAANVKHQGSGPNADRQKSAHAHCATPDPTGSFGLVCDLGTDEVVVYRIAAEPPTLVRQSAYKATPGSGPRHVDFSKDHRFAYVVNELDNTLDVLRWDAGAGTLRHEQRVAMLPPDFKPFSKAAEVAVHPSGAFVYGSNRGHDSLARYHVDRDSGHLSFAGHTPTGGKEPRHFSIDPSGRFLVAANQNSDNLVAFRIDAETGDLTPTGSVAEIAAPVCAVFAR